VLAEAGAEHDIHEVPGSFELPLAARFCAESGRYAGVVCLGAVIRGETDHYDFVCNEAARGIADVGAQTGVPCGFGVLTVDTMEQALARAGGEKRHTGEEAARAVLRMVELGRELQPPG
jgi:6,7-dimethyl-8-ribityllumazine synthase